VLIKREKSKGLVALQKQASITIEDDIDAIGVWNA
jgi:hypothetical protein